MSQALELRDTVLTDVTADALLARLGTVSPETIAHVGRVSNSVMYFTEEIAGLPMTEAVTSGVGSKLHDIGKLEPRILAIVQSPELLTEETRPIVNMHTAIGGLMVSGLRSSSGNVLHTRIIKASVFDIVHHHDTVQGLVRHAADNPRDALAVQRTLVLRAADPLDALTAFDRPYRRPISMTAAIDIVEAEFSGIASVFEVPTTRMIQMLAESLSDRSEQAA